MLPTGVPTDWLRLAARLARVPLGTPMPTPVARTQRILRAVLVALLGGAILAGCSVKHEVADVNQGKVLFQAKCGSCHTLAHANTTGAIGPNLDDAFRQDRIDGITGAAIQGFVKYWIEHPDAANYAPYKNALMPGGLYKGQQSEDVAAYVALVAAVPGHDTGQLALAGGVSGTTPAAGKMVFTTVGGCGGCHTMAAAGTTGTVGPNLDVRLRADCALPASKPIRGTTLQACIRKAIVDPYAYIPSGYAAGVMPATFGKTLTPAEITALVNFLAADTK